MSKSKDESGFSALETILILVIIGAIGFGGWYVWKAKHNINKAVVNGTQTTTSRTKSPIIEPTVKPDPYLGWQTYTNSQVSFKYPSDWTATMGRGQSRVADATSPSFASSAVTTAENPGAQITDYLQVSTDSLTIDCGSAPCQVLAITPLDNSQLSGAVLALVDQTSGNGTQFTGWVVANSKTKIGDTTITPVAAGSSNNIYVFGQPYYTPKGGGLTEAARVTNAASFQAGTYFKDLVNLINSIKFR